MWLITPYLEKARNKFYWSYVKWDILDIWCGPAYWLQFLEKWHKYIGIEYDKNHTIKLQKKYWNENINFKNLDINEDYLNFEITRNLIL